MYETVGIECSIGNYSSDEKSSKGVSRVEISDYAMNKFGFRQIAQKL